MSSELDPTVALEPLALPCQPWPWVSAMPTELAWQGLVQQIQAWLVAQALPARDAVVVLPQSAHVALASLAWAKHVNGWMPRFETVNTLLQRLPPDMPPSEATPAATPARLTLDPALDRLWVEQQLGALQGDAWRGRDAQTQVERVVGLAHAWLKLCLVLPPDQRALFAAQAQQWALAQNTDRAADNPNPQIGADERRLAQWAMQWAVESWPSLSPRTSAIFGHQPAAWLMVSIGPMLVPGTESDLMRHVLMQAAKHGLPVCWMPAVWQPTPESPQALPTLTQAKDFDQEAMLAAAWVIDRVNYKRAQALPDPVLLVTQDRALSRRIRALLMPLEASGQLVLSDESGWALPTTRAAAALTRHLQAASKQATTADVQDWLCHGWLQHGQVDAAVHALTQHWQKQQIFRPWQQTKADQLPPMCQDLWAWLQEVRSMWQMLERQRLPLCEAVQVLRQVLEKSGAWQALCDDAAGQQVLQCVRCEDVVSAEEVVQQWQFVSQSQLVDVLGLAAWVDQSLRAATFVPSRQHADVDVVMTPMVRAVLRPFSAVIWPGADARQLAPPVPTRHLLGQQEEALGLATAEQLSQAQWQAFALLASHPEVHAICRSSVDGEPVEPSAWLKRWAIAQTGGLTDVPPQGWPLQDAPSAGMTIAHQAKTRSAPSVLTPLLPVKMSPSGYERLRSCPYRYYVSDILGIKSVQALEEGLAKNDYGTWLHEVLKRFHEADMQATQPANASQNVATLLALADEVAAKQGMLTPEKSAAFALRRSAITSVLAAYANWHEAQTQAGWQTQAVEQTFSLNLSLPSDDEKAVPVATIRLYGQLDRVDRLRSEGQTQWRVIDYKTSSVSSLSSKVRAPLEDTQLAFYAALLDQWSDAIEALYLSLDREVKAVAHADVKDSAQQLLDGLRDDLTRIYQGQTLPALGEGQVCDFCDARGICRKDHWSAKPAQEEHA